MRKKEINQQVCNFLIDRIYNVRGSKKEVMSKPNLPIAAVSEENILEKIYLIRGQKVMIDRDLAEMYGVEVKRMNQAIKRNAIRFPDDFMFQINSKEFQNLKSQIVTIKLGVDLGSCPMPSQNKE